MTQSTYKINSKRKCPSCRHTGIDKSRALDGRMQYTCQKCQRSWTEGMQGRKRFTS